VVERKKFKKPLDALWAVRAERFINKQPHGAGQWEDCTTVVVPGVLKGTLKISDKIGDDNTGAERWIELRSGKRLIVTFVYNHHTEELIRMF
jgi:hypothetical protein